MADLLTWNGERGIRGGVTLARVRMSHLDPGSPQWEWTCVVGDCVWRGALSEADGQAKAEDAVRDWFERIGVVATDQVEWRALRRVARTVRCLARDIRAEVEAAAERLTARLELADTVNRSRRSDAYGQALRALYHDRSIPIPDDRRDDALAAFEQLINQGIDVPTAYAMVTGEDWLPGEQ